MERIQKVYYHKNTLCVSHVCVCPYCSIHCWSAYLSNAPDQQYTICKLGIMVFTETFSAKNNEITA